MKLEQLIQKCKPIRIVGNPDIDIKGVIRIREEDIEKQGRNQLMNVIIVGE